MLVFILYVGRMITSRKLLVYPDEPDQVHCRCEELASASAPHKYNINAYKPSGDTQCSSGCNEFLPNSSASPWNPFFPNSTSGNKYQALKPHLIDRFVYPSPPPTSLQPGRSVPLPNDHCQTPYSLTAERPLEYHDNPDETPDFSLMMEHGSQWYQEPLSPPPTLPTQTLILPPADGDLAQLESYFDFPMSHPHAHLDTSGGPSHHHLPSPPLSPDRANMTVARVSYPASAQSSLFIQGISYPGPPMENDVHLYDQPSPPRPWQQHLNNDIPPKVSDILSTSFDLSPPTHMLEAEDCLYPISWGYLTIDRQRTPTELEDLDDTSHTYFPTPGSPLISSPASSDHDSDFHDHDYEDEFTLPPSSPCRRSVSELPMLEDEGDDPLGLSNPFEDDQPWNFEPAQSLSDDSSAGCGAGRVPSIRSFPGVDTDEDLIPVDLASRSWAPEHCIVIPSTPYITPSTLIPSPDSSSYLMNSLQQGDATRYSSNSLLLVDDPSARSPIIGSSCHIGAELDQLDPVLVASDAELKGLLDLRSRALASERQARMVEAQYKNIKAFWIGRAIVSGEGIGADYDSGVAEERDMQRHLHLEEARMQAVLAMQAKRARKREKERVREVSALMKIKLKERGISFKKTSPGSPMRHVKDVDVDVDGICVTDGFLQDSETDDSVMIDHTHRSGHRTKSDKGNITTMPQLVARMTLRRREARLRPSTRPRTERCSEVLSDPGPTPSPGRSYTKSPLALSSSTDHEQITMAQNDTLPSIGLYQAQSPPLHWPMDVDCHTCPDSVIGSLDDLDVTSKFDLLSLSNT